MSCGDPPPTVNQHGSAFEPMLFVLTQRSTARHCRRHVAPPTSHTDHRARAPLSRPGAPCQTGVLIAGTPGGEDVIYRAAGLTGPSRLEIPGQIVNRSTDEVAAGVCSLSSAAPHLFGDRLEQFDAELRRLLADTARAGQCSEVLPPIAIDIWR